MKSVGYLMVAAVLSSLVATNLARADDATGPWVRDNGESRVQIGACSQALCGHFTWVKPPAKRGGVGMKVFFDMAPAGNGKWSGKAFNPEDGKTYSGAMQAAGNRLAATGCARGGII
jgi:uncharacterized protein (DUF2147 family)